MIWPTMEQPLVSIGVPTFNRPQLLRRALELLVGQTYRNIEIIVSDNASPDDQTKKVVEEFANGDGRIKYFRQPENIGAANNFLFVLEKAAGDYFMWAADDDEWTSDFVDFGLAHIGNAGTIMGDIDTVFHVRGETTRSLVPNLDPTRSAFSNAKAFLGNMQPSILYGLHNTDFIRICVTRNTFDFWDCFVVYKIIINYGIRTYRGVRYRAGVATSEYEIKPCNQASNRLRYLPFVTATLKETWACARLKLSEKITLALQIIYVTLSLYRHHSLRRK